MAAVDKNVCTCIRACVFFLQFLFHSHAFKAAFLYLISLGSFLTIIPSQRVSSPSCGSLVYCTVAHCLKRTECDFSLVNKDVQDVALA